MYQLSLLTALLVFTYALLFDRDLYIPGLDGGADHGPEEMGLMVRDVLPRPGPCVHVPHALRPEEYVVFSDYKF